VPLCDSIRALAICRLLVDDRQDLVVKALSWALRAVSKYDAAAVRAFLEEHRDRLAARVRREVGTKLATGRKNPRYQTPGSKR
jgi:3-methyladenine DNA glycosylase AlkD